MKRFWQTAKKKGLVLAALAAALVLCGTVTLRAQWGGAVMASAEVTNWGLRFGEEGQPPRRQCG